MSFFGSDKEKGGRPRIERVQTADIFTGYQHTSWDPYSLIRDEINTISVQANAEGDHLWSSSEALQAEAGSTWLMATRQAIGDELASVAQNGKIPRDVSEVALANYQSSRSWRQYHETTLVNANSYQIDATIAHSKLTWPQPNHQPLSQELLTSTYETAKHLLFLYLPALLASFETSLPYPAEFKKYDQQIVRKIELIQRRFQRIDDEWNDALHPNIAPGDQVYKELAQLVEDIIQFGVVYLIPVVGDPIYKLGPKKRPFAIDPNAFSASRSQPPRPAIEPIKSPAFDPTAMHLMNPQSPATPPSSAAFDPTAFQHRTADSETTIEKIQAEPFDAGQFTQRHLGAQAIAQSNSSQKEFDPKSHIHPHASKDQTAFDPKRYRHE